MKEKRFCAICNSEMEYHNNISYIDYTCAGVDRHFLIERFVENKRVKLKTRFTDSLNNKLYLKIHFDKDKMEIWTKSNDSERIYVNGSFDPDFSDVDKLKQKIKMMMLFS